MSQDPRDANLLNSSIFLKVPSRYAYNNHMLLHIQLSLDFSSMYHQGMHTIITLSLDFSLIFLKVPLRYAD